MIRPLFAGLMAASLCPPALAAERSILVLDGSGSMWGQIEGRSKIEIAREALADVLRQVPDETELGLIVYGHREKGACADIELAITPATGTASAIADFAAGIAPKGKTPLSEAVRQAAAALRSTEERATVILVTDGVETCDADPCALGRELEQTGVDFTVHVIGFGLSADEGAQVSCLAESTGGRYIEAGDAARLGAALRATVVAESAPEPEPPPAPEPAGAPFNLMASAALSEESPDIEGTGLRWDLFPLGADGEPGKKSVAGSYEARFKAKAAPGRYLLRVRLGRVTRERTLELTASEPVELRILMDAARLSVIPKRRAEEAEAEAKARVDVIFPGGKDGSYGAGQFHVAAGEVTVKARIGKAEVEERLTLAAGESVEKILVVGSGLVEATAEYAEGGPAIESNGIRYSVLAATPGIDGKRKEIVGRTGSGTLDVPVGEYRLQARLGKAEALSEPFRVEAGVRLPVVIRLNGGVLAVSAPGAHRIDIRGAEADIQGRRQGFGGGYGETFQETLPPGEYQVVVGYKSDRATQERSASVKAGERVEIRVD